MPPYHRPRIVARRLGLAAVATLLAALLTMIGVTPASAAGTASISGVVTNTRGEPLPNSSVRVFLPEDSHILKVIAQVYTDEHGAFTFSGLAAGDYGVHAYGPSGTEYLGETWDNARSRRTPTVIALAEGEARTGIDLQLVLGGVVRGVVTDSAGVPMSGAFIRWQRMDPVPDSADQTEWSATTDESGAYEVRRVIPGTYNATISITDPSYVTLHSDPIVVAGDVITPFDASLTRASMISGTVFLGSEGTRAGADEVVVTARKYATSSSSYTDYTAATDADGYYGFPALSSGRYDVKFDYVGDGGFAEQWWPANPVASPNTTPFTLGEEPLTRDMTLPLGASVSGTVRNAAGAPIGNVQVTASALDPGGYYGMVAVDTVRTAADGTYAFEGLPPAASAIEFWTETDYVQARSDLDLLSGDVHTGFDVTMYRYTSLSGTIECPGCGDPDAVTQYLLARLERNVGTRSEPAWIDAGSDFVTASNSADLAVYRFDGLVPGSYRVRITGDWGVNPKRNASPAVQVDDGDDITLNLTIEFLGFDRDFSGDGRPDVIARTGGGALLMYTGDGASSWTGASTIGSGWSVMNHVFAAGDFSGDGHEDVMARDAGGRLHLYRGDGKGGWLGWGLVGTGWGHMTAIFSPGDFSGDGNVDVLARDGAGDLWLYSGDGTGGWGSVSKVGTGWNIFDQLFAVGNYGGYGEANVMGRTSAGDLWVYPASGSGGWTIPARVGTGWNVFDAVFGSGDFNGDGTDDVMGRDRAGRLWLYPGAGHNGWGAPAIVGTGWGQLSFVS